MTVTYRSAGTALTNNQIDSNIKTVENRYSGIPIASAATLTLQDEYNYFVVSGSVTMTGLPDVSAGFRITLHFTGAPLLTHSSTFIMPGGVDIQAAAGDVAVFQQEDTGTQVWRCVSYTYKANALETFVTQAIDNDTTKVATTAFVDRQVEVAGGWHLFESSTTITSGYIEVTGFIRTPKRIRVNFYNVTYDGGGATFQLGLRGNGSYASTLSGTTVAWNSPSGNGWGATYEILAANFDSTDVLSGWVEFTRYATKSYSVIGEVYRNDGGASHTMYSIAGVHVPNTAEVDGVILLPGTGNLLTAQMDVWVMQ